VHEVQEDSILAGQAVSQAAVVFVTSASVYRSNEKTVFIQNAPITQNTAIHFIIIIISVPLPALFIFLKNTHNHA